MSKLNYVLMYTVALAIFSPFSFASYKGFYVGSSVGAGFSSFSSYTYNISDYMTDHPSFEAQLNTSKIMYSEYFAGEFSNFALFGNLSVGYNFKKVSDLPLRVEIAYKLNNQISKNIEGNINGTDHYLDIDNSTSDNLIYSSEAVTADSKINIKGNISTLMVNGYYDFYNRTKFTPFLAFGLGIAFNNLENTAVIKSRKVSLQDSSATLALAVGAGISYSLTSNWDFDINANYINNGVNFSSASKIDTNMNLETISSVKENLRLHSFDLLIGARYSF